MSLRIKEPKNSEFPDMDMEERKHDFSNDKGIMGYNIRRYIEGQLVGQLPPVTLPENPWIRRPLEEAPPLKQNSKPTKYGLEKLSVGQSLVVPLGREDQRTVWQRLRKYINARKFAHEERYKATQVDNGVEVVRTK